MAERSRQTSHDPIFRILVESLERAASLLSGCLPPEITGRIAYETLERLPNTFVDTDLGLHHADAVFRARPRNRRSIWIYILLEHKSSRDPWAPLQMHRYVTNIWTWHSRRSRTPPGVLPQVVPVLVHQGPGPWKGALSVLDMVEGADPPEGGAGGLSCVLCDLGAMETAELPGNPEVRAILAAMKHARDEEVPKNILHDILSDIHVGSDLERPLVRYIMRTYNKRTQRNLMAALCGAWPGRRGKELMETIAEAMIAERIEERLAERIEERLEERRAVWMDRGRAEGKAETFLRQARIRFGSLPEVRREEVLAADPATLDRWLDALLTAEDLEIVFGSPP